MSVTLALGAAVLVGAVIGARFRAPALLAAVAPAMLAAVGAGLAWRLSALDLLAFAAGVLVALQVGFMLGLAGAWLGYVRRGEGGRRRAITPSPRS